MFFILIISFIQEHILFVAKMEQEWTLYSLLPFL